MKLPYASIALLALTGTATAQITLLGGGVAPLFVSGLPSPGQTLQISPLPAPFPVVLVGINRVDIPLAPYGPGCPDTLIPSLDILSAVTCSVPIPNNPAVVGFTFYAQGMLGGMGLCNIGFYVQLTQAVRITIQ